MTPSLRRLRTAVERLEDRSLPSTFGVPWADANLTLSFVSDGTATPTGPSSLSATLAPTGAEADWQREILRAFQTWAVNANINIGLVADGGQALGTAGAVQGDARFGDVRVAAAPLTPDEVAAAAPFSWTGSTFAGDVLLNRAMQFTRGGGAGTYDLYSVALHEAGHVLGLAHEGEDTVMNAGYVFSTGLSADEIADLQAMYGTRTADTFDLKGSNGTFAKASALEKDPTTGHYAADADLTTSADVDVFSFKATSTTATVTLQAKGLSLLQAQVSVYDAAGKVIASGAAADVFNNDVTLNLTRLKPNATYFVKVAGATDDVFGIGAYRLTAGAGTDKAPKPVTQPSMTDAHTNDTTATATELISFQARALDARFDATYHGTIEDSSDNDFYRIRMPLSSGGGAVNLNVMVWATDGALDPRVQVFDARGNAVSFRVLANDDGLMSVVVPNAAGGIYYVQVSGKTTGATGGYVLAADFNTFAVPPAQGVDNGQLSSSEQTATGAFTVEGGLYQFSLVTEALSAGAGGVTLTVTDPAGKVVFTLDGASGDPAVTRSVYLLAGTYTLTYAYRTASALTAAPIGYHLAAMALSEGVGTYAPITTTTTAPTTTTSPTTTLTSPTTPTTASTTTYTAPTTTTKVLAPTTSTTTYTAPTTSVWYGTWYSF